MDYKNMAAACTRGENPACEVVCPFGLDVRNFASRMRRGAFDSAYRLLRDTFVFPETALRLCPAPCADACERNASDKAVNLSGLELAAVRLAKKKEPLRLNVPSKTERIAVIGGGISGLACALRLSSRRYKVAVYERADRLGGSLWSRFPDGWFLDEILLQFKHTDCEFHLSRDVDSLTDIQADAVYVATGSGGETFRDCGQSVFSGGGIIGAHGVFALRQGIDASNNIESFLKTGAVPQPARLPERPVNRPDPSLLSYTPPVEPSGAHYSGEEAVREANRCMLCDCDSCARRCTLIRHYNRFPKRIAEDAEGTVRPADLIQNRLATRMVASCDQCGLCADACPQGVDVRAILAGAKREMASEGSLPKSFTAFWLADMIHAEKHSFTLKPDSGERNGYMFFPGCRLGASDPRYVSETYKRLLEKYPDTVLMADCCGAPAYWAGEVRLFEEKSARLRRCWEELGSPVPVCACPTCADILKNALPGCKPVSLYSLDLGCVPARSGEVSVFDPCSSRFDAPAQEGVRRILKEAGFAIYPLPFERGDTLCCGWGGQYMPANPGMSREAAMRCAALSEQEYVTYCVNCRDAIADTGKRVSHILDVLLDIDASHRGPLTHSARRRNRETLLNTMTGALPARDEDTTVLHIDGELREKISADWLLEEDILKVIQHCEQSGEKVINPETGVFAGHLRVGYFTYWVLYEPEGAGYRLLNAYAHKLELDERFQA